MKSMKLLAAALALGLASQANAAAVDRQDDARVNNPKVSFVDAITGQKQSMVRCGVAEPTRAERDAMERKLQDFRRSPEYFSKVNKLAAVKYIPVYFHMITTNSGAGAGTQQQLTDQINVLNAAYANSGFQFTLAGSQIVKNTTWYNGCAKSSIERAMKKALAVNPKETFNVYSCGLGAGLLGYATFPNYYAENSFMHGVVMLNGALPGGNASGYNGGDTLTHEAGHYLGLYHTFQGGCVEPGDSVADTPAEAAPNFDCTPADTCPQAGVDPVNNYMDYGNDACMTNFTGNQWTRMQEQVALYKPNLG